MKKWLYVLALLVVLAVPFLAAGPVLALSYATITVTATGNYLDVTVAPTTWSINGGGVLTAGTTYYSKPSAYTTPPSNPVVDGECSHTFTNSSSVAVDVTIKFSDMTGTGNPWVNSDDGSNGSLIFGSKAQASGLNWSAAVVAKNAATYSTLISSLTAAGTKKIVVSFVTPTAFDDSNQKTGTITLTATQH